MTSSQRLENHPHKTGEPLTQAGKELDMRQKLICSPQQSPIDGGHLAVSANSGF